jgi:hypothetical protein
VFAVSDLALIIWAAMDGSFTHDGMQGAPLGRAFRLLAIGSVVGMILGVLATRVLSYIVYQATPKHPIVLGGVVLTMLAVGLVARCAFELSQVRAGFVLTDSH